MVKMCQPAAERGRNPRTLSCRSVLSAAPAEEYGDQGAQDREDRQLGKQALGIEQARGRPELVGPAWPVKEVRRYFRAGDERLEGGGVPRKVCGSRIGMQLDE